MTIPVKRLPVLFLVTACALVATLGVAQLARAGATPTRAQETRSPAEMDVMTLTLSSSRPHSFYDPGPRPVDRTVFFNNQGPQGQQVISATAAFSTSEPISYFLGAPAFGMTPTLVTTAPWMVTYSIKVSDSLQPGVTFAAVTTSGLVTTRAITFTPDLTTPFISLLDVPDYGNGPFTVRYTSDDTGSGVARTRLWYQPPATTTWQPAGPSIPGVGGGLYFAPSHGEGAYWFSVESKDRVGNLHPGRTVSDSRQTIYDVSAPQAVITGPALISHSQIILHWWATDTLSGPAGTQLWVRPPATSTWGTAGPPQPGLSGTISYTADAPGRYEFAAVATDWADNTETAPPPVGEVETLYDPDPPILSAITITSSCPDRFHAPDLGTGTSGGDLFFNDALTQVVVVSIDWSDANPASLAAGPAFGVAATQIQTPPWQLSYTLPVSAPTHTPLHLTLRDGGGLVTTATLTFVRDRTQPAVQLSAPGFAHKAIPIQYNTSDPGGSGTADLQLWGASLPTATWQTGLAYATGVTGTLLYTPAVEGRFAWGAVVTDHVGNRSPAPTLNGVQTVYDLTPPEAQLDHAGGYVNVAPISLPFVATDTLSGIAQTQLWVRRPPSTTWFTLPLTLPGVSGTFAFSPTGGDGAYEFATRASDRAGNLEALPSLAEAALVLDRQPPSSNVSAAPYPSEGIIQLTWIATDTVSGLSLLTLWASQPPTHTWESLAFSSTQASGSTAFVPKTSGVYYFAAVAEDRAGNVEPAPTGEGDSTSWLDSHPPVITATGILEESPYLYAQGNTLFYSNGMALPAVFVVTGIASDTGSGLDRVVFDPAFGDSPADDLTPAEWMADYTVSSADEGDGLITVRVYDRASLSATVTFSYAHDLTPPTSTLPVLPEVSADGQITFPWHSADDGSGVAFTELWVRSPAAGWSLAGPLQSGESGTFSYTLPIEGRHHLAAVAVDRVGNRERPPEGDGDGSVLYDGTPPQSAANSGWATVSSPITVSWTVTDALSGVAWTELWVRVGAAGVWTHTGAISTTLGGVFTFSPTVEARYAFATLAQDQVGNREPQPTGLGDSTTIYDLTGPTAVITAPDTSGYPSFEVQWGASDPGEGVGLHAGGAYTVEYRVGENGWTPWLTASNQLSATFGPTLPVPIAYETPYSFRVRARDALGNVGDPVSATTTVRYFRIYLPSIQKRYRSFSNGDFELGLTGWSRGGELVASLTGDMRHSGRWAMILGSPAYVCLNGVPVGSGWVETEFTLPNPDEGSVTLQLWYNMWTQDSYDPADPYAFDGLQVDINNNPVGVVPADGPANCSDPTAVSGWQFWELPIPSRYWGKNITLRISNHNRPDGYYNTWTYVDDVIIVEGP